MGMEGFKYNEKVGNYCRTRPFGFVKPYEQLRLRDLPESEMLEAVNAIYFLRHGDIDWKILGDREYAKRLAQEIGVW